MYFYNITTTTPPAIGWTASLVYTQNSYHIEAKEQHWLCWLFSLWVLRHRGKWEVKGARERRQSLSTSQALKQSGLSQRSEDVKQNERCEWWKVEGKKGRGEKREDSGYLLIPKPAGECLKGLPPAPHTLRSIASVNTHAYCMQGYSSQMEMSIFIRMRKLLRNVQHKQTFFFLFFCSRRFIKQNYLCVLKLLQIYTPPLFCFFKIHIITRDAHMRCLCSVWIQVTLDLS